MIALPTLDGVREMEAPDSVSLSDEKCSGALYQAGSPDLPQIIARLDQLKAGRILHEVPEPKGVA